MQLTSQSAVFRIVRLREFIHLITSKRIIHTIMVLKHYWGMMGNFLKRLEDGLNRNKFFIYQKSNQIAAN